MDGAGLDKLLRIRSVALSGLAALLLFCLSGFLLHAQQREEPTKVLPQTHSVEDRQAAPEAPSPGDGGVGSDYIIGPEDILRIDVFQVPDLSGQALRVANDGTITVPLLGRVKAVGLTTTELANNLQSAWGKNYLQNPQVNVYVVQFQARPVSVVGAVERPGLYYLTGPRSLIEVLGMAGGLAKRQSDIPGPKLYVTRRDGFGDSEMAPGMSLVGPDKVEIQISKLLYSNDAALNIPIKPLDVISVSKAGVVYVAGGGVQGPGGFVLEDRDSVTALQALAMAGGFKPSAAKRYGRIIREGSNGQRIEIPVDMERVVKGKAADPVLAANDILFIPDSTQKAALRRAVDVTLSTLSGLLIFGKI